MWSALTIAVFFRWGQNLLILADGIHPGPGWLGARESLSSCTRRLPWLTVLETYHKEIHHASLPVIPGYHLRSSHFSHLCSSAPSTSPSPHCSPFQAFPGPRASALSALAAFSPRTPSSPCPHWTGLPSKALPPMVATQMDHAHFLTRHNPQGGRKALLSSGFCSRLSLRVLPLAVLLTNALGSVSTLVWGSYSESCSSHWALSLISHPLTTTRAPHHNPWLFHPWKGKCRYSTRPGPLSDAAASISRVPSSWALVMILLYSLDAQLVASPAFILFSAFILFPTQLRLHCPFFPHFSSQLTSLLPFPFSVMSTLKTLDQFQCVTAPCLHPVGHSAKERSPSCRPARSHLVFFSLYWALWFSELAISKLCHSSQWPKTAYSLGPLLFLQPHLLLFCFLTPVQPCWHLAQSPSPDIHLTNSLSYSNAADLWSTWG